MPFLLYRLTFANGKSYIGQTVRTLHTRIAQHRRAALNGGSLLPVHCAWRAHGEPVSEVMSEHESHEDLHAAEVNAIAACLTICPHGYNVSIGGDTATSKNPLVAAKIAEKAKGRKHSEEAKRKIAEHSKLQWQCQHYRDKVAANVRSAWTPEMRAARAEQTRIRQLGKRRSEATKEKLRGRVFSDETRAKMSAAAKARRRTPASQETRAKLSATAKAQWQRPGVASAMAKAISQSLTGKPISPVVLAARAERRAALLSKESV